MKEESKQGHNGEDAEANGCNIERRVASCDSLDIKEVSCLLVTGALTVSHLVTFSVKSIGAYEVRSSGDVALNDPVQGLEALVVWLFNDLERTSLVLI